MKSIARAYIRLSGRDEKERVSPEIQLGHCQKIANDNGWILVPYDEGAGLHSAHKRTNIPQWNKLFKDALDNEDTAAVIAYDLSRQFRNSEAFKHQVQELLKHQIRVIFSVEGEVDFDKADSVLIWGFRAEIAEYESRKTSERLRNYHQGLRDKGVYTGHRAPFGLRRIGHGNDNTLRFELIPAQMKVVIAAFTLYARGMGTPSIAQQLRQSGYHWRSVKGDASTHIGTSHVKFLIDRVEFYREFLDGRLYSQVLRERHKRRNNQENGARLKHQPVLLWRLAYCAECGQRLAQSVRTRVGGRLDERLHHRYHPTCSQSEKVYYCTKINAQLWDWLKTHLTFTPDDIEQLAEKVVAPPPLSADELDTKLLRQKLERALANLPRMLAEEDITPEQYRALKADYEVQLKTPSPSLPVLPKMSKAEVMESLATLSAVETLEADYHLQPTETNHFLRQIIDRVLIRTNLIVTVELAAPFNRLVQA